MKRPPPPPSSGIDVPHRVYRCYDADDRLVYIGVTSLSVAQRLRGHRRTNRAVWEATVRTTSEEYPNKAAAWHAEAYAIYDEAPLLNHRHNARRVRGAGFKLLSEMEPTQEELREAVMRLPSASPPALAAERASP